MQASWKHALRVYLAETWLAVYRWCLVARQQYLNLGGPATICEIMDLKRNKETNHMINWA